MLITYCVKASIFSMLKKIVSFARRKEELIKNILSEEYDNEGEVDQQSFIAEQQR